MPRPSTPGSCMSSTMKENKPVWCSPGLPHSTVLRAGKGRPLGELKSGNRGLSLDGPGSADKALISVAKKAAAVQKGSPSALKGKTKVVRAPPSQVLTVRVLSPITTSRLKATKAPVTDETPPRSRPTKKPVAALVTPTNKFRKPLTTTICTPRGVTKPKVSTPKGGTGTKASTPASSRAREKNQAPEGTPVRNVRDRPRGGASAGGAQEIPKSGSRDNNRVQHQGVSAWGGSSAANVRGRKASPTHGRPPVKHLFLSPPVSKKTVSKKDLVRKSIEVHGIWVGSAASLRKQRAPTAEKKRDVVESEMPPPAQPSNSPEIPKRGSREASGEGIGGYFGAGPMVAPNGVGFVRDRRKCKPRGTLMVGQEGLSMDSDSSGVVESSVVMPPPSVASVEWMMNKNDAKVGLNVNNFSSGSIHEPAVSTSISDFPVRDNQASESFGKEERRTSQEHFCDAALEQLKMSSPNDGIHCKLTKRSQAFPQHLDHETSESFGQERMSQEEDICDRAVEQLRLSSPSDDIYSKFSKRSQAFLQHLDSQTSGSFGKGRTSQEEDVCDRAVEQLRLSSPSDDMYSKFTKRSQAFLQHLDSQTSGSFEKERTSLEEDVCDRAVEQLRLSSPSDDIYSKFTKRSQAFLQHLDSQTSGSFGKERTSQEEEDVCDGGLEQWRLSSPNDHDKYSKFTKRSQAFLHHLEMRQSQLTRAASFSYVRQFRLYRGDESLRRGEELGGVVDSDLEYDEDVTIDWRQGLPSDSSMEMADRAAGLEASAGKNELVRSSLSFTSSWVPPSEDNSRRLSGSGNAKTFYAPDSPWYGFSPITPEFHRNSQLPEGGTKAIDALVAGSVRRRIMTDKSSSSSDGKLDISCTSLTQSMQVVNPQDSSSSLSAANSSQETSSSFQFPRNSYASASAIDMEPMPLDNFMCQTSSPIERSPFSEDLICQTASPIDQVYSVACSIDCSVAGSIDGSVDCSIDCSVNASDDDEVEYASPIMGDYLSPAKRSSPLARSDKISTDLSTVCDEINTGARAVRKSSMSRTLEELMRHNFTL